jgi:hypothetical protein
MIIFKPIYCLLCNKFRRRFRRRFLAVPIKGTLQVRVVKFLILHFTINYLKINLHIWNCVITINFWTLLLYNWLQSQIKYCISFALELSIGGNTTVGRWSSVRRHYVNVKYSENTSVTFEYLGSTHTNIMNYKHRPISCNEGREEGQMKEDESFWISDLYLPVNRITIIIIRPSRLVWKQRFRRLPVLTWDGWGMPWRMDGFPYFPSSSRRLLEQWL